MTLTRDKELWAVALQIEQIHGPDAAEFIEGRILKFEQESDEGGANLWRQIAERYFALNPDA
ncbi:DUF6961 family protein [Croceicoccus mobilis]|uniref:Uncharacterized protein n=1 Tax=Croceicoccus mobilis TaxID=1703339 RepID=A0A916Z9Z0_9SPHN|nr:hypothetical protein [Croceicoccus mobilis]GGD83124.1 hypothetical protein GCM10010990_36500 [Croceicoccus mobilis]